jgi:hypothetical protein
MEHLAEGIEEFIERYYNRCRFAFGARLPVTGASSESKPTG